MSGRWEVGGRWVVGGYTVFGEGVGFRRRVGGGGEQWFQWLGGVKTTVMGIEFPLNNNRKKGEKEIS